MTLAVRYTSARTLDTAPALSAPPGPGEVELAPAYVGICGTDLHIFHGDMDARIHTPAVLGHETFRIAGTIASHKGSQLAVKTKQGREESISVRRNNRDRGSVNRKGTRPWSGFFESSGRSC